MNDGLPPDLSLQNTESSILLRVWVQPLCTCVCFKCLWEMWPDTLFFFWRFMGGFFGLYF